MSLRPRALCVIALMTSLFAACGGGDDTNDAADVAGAGGAQGVAGGAGGAGNAAGESGEGQGGTVGGTAGATNEGGAGTSAGGTGAGSAGTTGASAGAGGVAGAAGAAGGSGAAGQAGGTPQVDYVGRFDTSDPAGPKFEWPGSYAHAHFTGTSVSVKLRDGGSNQYEVVVDDKVNVLKPTAGTNDYSLASGLAPGEHDVVVYRRTESFFGPGQFFGFTFAGGKLLAPKTLSRRIEFIGDSITCGYGDEGKNQTCSFSAGTENNYLAYGPLTARALNAEPHVVAWSGKGAYRDHDGKTDDQMPVLYGRTIPTDGASTWDFASWEADVVVINLGTNDFAKGDPGQAFVTSYQGLVAAVRKHYPKAHVFCSLGPMLGGANLTTARTYVNQVVDASHKAGDDKVHYLEYKGTTSGGFGCDYHPNVKTHQLMSDALTAAIKSATGW